ncbi:hypothetical protein PTTG_27065 [Puccinia triticina 1-1 BBBD Race 1]|uniref:Uncharacterized protein n=1 Tax=Puccinia triticina (isolate 1-1 / race 1 (BBBD)) TaxID=630390 RepID=A0A180GNU2_PUCT1|nr:hypothetical protein PTTG_27065 [Puccinia triticina 1-1 BBBD Race 1]
MKGLCQDSGVAQAHRKRKDQSPNPARGSATSEPDAEPKRPKRSGPSSRKLAPNANPDLQGYSLNDCISDPSTGVSKAKSIDLCTFRNTKSGSRMAGSRSNPAPAAPAPASAPVSDDRDTFKCPNFTGKNFPIWQRKVKTYLAVKSLTKCIEQPLPPNASEEVKLQYV